MLEKGVICAIYFVLKVISSIHLCFMSFKRIKNVEEPLKMVLEDRLFSVK